MATWIVRGIIHYNLKAILACQLLEHDGGKLNPLLHRRVFGIPVSANLLFISIKTASVVRLLSSLTM